MLTCKNIDFGLKRSLNFFVPCHWFRSDRVVDRRYSARTCCQLQLDSHRMDTVTHTQTQTKAQICSAAPTRPSQLSPPTALTYWMLPPILKPFSLLSSIHPSSCLFFSTSPTPRTLTTSTKLTPQARSVLSVGGVRCWHFPPPLHWAQLQHWTGCLLSLSFSLTFTSAYFSSRPASYSTVAHPLRSTNRPITKKQQQQKKKTTFATVVSEARRNLATSCTNVFKMALTV